MLKAGKTIPTIGTKIDGKKAAAIDYVKLIIFNRTNCYYLFYTKKYNNKS